MNEKNKIIASGRIIGYGQNEYGHKGFTLFIRNNSVRTNNNNQNRNRRTENLGTYIHFAYAKDIDIPFDIALHSTVEVVGHIEGNIVRNQVWNKTSYIQYMVADEIRKVSTQLEESFPMECKGKGFAYSSPFVKVSLMGKVVNIEKSNHNTSDGNKDERVWTRLRLKVDPVVGARNPSLIEMQYSSNMRVSDVDCRVGDTICLTAMIVSRQKQIRGTQQTRIFEDIIVNDMAIIDRPQEELEDNSVLEALKEEEAPQKQPEQEQEQEVQKSRSFGGLEIGKKDGE